VVAVLFCVYGVSRIDTYLVSGYDLGIFDQAVRHYSLFQAPIVTLKGDGYSIWADHFHPIIAAWAPLYWIWDDIRVLVIGQALVVAAAVFPLWAFLTRRLGRGVWPIVFVGATMLGWPIQCLIDFDVHEIAFAVPLLAWVVESLDAHRDRTLLIACPLLLLVREDMGALVCVIGLVRLIWGRPTRAIRPADWRAGLALIVAGVTVFVVVTQVVIPAFAPQGFQYWDYPVLSATSGPGGILATAGHALADLVTPTVKIWTWLALLVPVGFLALASPYALIAAPIMAERMLAAREPLWTTHFHYNAPVWMILCLAAVDGAERLWRRWGAHGRAAPQASPVHTTPDATTRAPASTKVLTAWLAGCITLGMAVSFSGLLPRVTEIFPLYRVVAGSAFRTSPQAESRAEVVAWLPADTCVAADDRVAGHLTHSNRVTVPGVSEHRQVFYVLDLSEPRPATTDADWSTAHSLDVAEGLGFRQVFQAGSIIVLQAPDYAGPDPLACGPTAP